MGKKPRKKGLDRDKDLWERMAEKETEMIETVLKELKQEKKCARSKKKKNRIVQEVQTEAERKY